MDQLEDVLADQNEIDQAMRAGQEAFVDTDMDELEAELNALVESETKEKAAKEAATKKEEDKGLIQQLEALSINKEELPNAETSQREDEKKAAVLA